MDRSTGSRVNEEDTNDTEDTNLAGHTQTTVVQRMAPKYVKLHFGKNQHEHHHRHKISSAIFTKCDIIPLLLKLTLAYD